MWPFLIQTSAFAIPTYIAVNSLVFTLGVLWLYLRAPARGMNRNRVLDVSLALMLGGFVGARMFHVLFEHPEFYWKHPSFIFKFWYGGFVYYGGMIVGMAACYAVCRVQKQNFWKMADFFAPVLAAGYAVGRLGCLAAGCCYGRETHLPWGIIFPQGVEAPPGIPLHPTQIYSALWETAALGVLLALERRRRLILPGQLFGFWMILHGFGRLVIEQFRGDFRGATILSLSISSWISAAVIIFGIWLVATARETPKRVATSASTSF